MWGHYENTALQPHQSPSRPHPAVTGVGMGKILNLQSQAETQRYSLGNLRTCSLEGLLLGFFEPDQGPREGSEWPEGPELRCLNTRLKGLPGTQQPRDFLKMGSEAFVPIPVRWRVSALLSSHPDAQQVGIAVPTDPTAHPKAGPPRHTPQSPHTKPALRQIQGQGARAPRPVQSEESTCLVSIEEEGHLV